MNSFERVIKEARKLHDKADKPNSAEVQTWLSGRCTKGLIIDLTNQYLSSLDELPKLSTATSEGREESDFLKGKIHTLESILNDITEIPEDSE